MKKILFYTVCHLFSIVSFSQVLTGSKIEIFSTDSHLARFYYNDNATTATRPRLDIFGYPNKINLRTTHGSGGAHLSFGTHTVPDALFISHNGLIGIGNTAPDTKLHLEESNVGIKTTYATQIIEANDAQLDLISSSAGNWGSAINLVEGNGDANNDIWSIVRRTSNDNSSLRINYGTSNNHQNPSLITFNTNGNVGIGTDAPTKLLHLRKDVPSEIVPVIQLQNKQYDYSEGAGSSIKFFGHNENRNITIEATMRGNGRSNRLDFEFQDDEIHTNAMSIKYNGNVGIGTKSPTAKLEIEKSNLENAFSVGSSNDGGRIYTSYESGRGTLNFIEHDDPFVLSFTQAGTNTNEKIIFDQGNFGIGTTTMGSHKLAVEGSI
ncbi:tail fiber protein, partial [Mesonia oceanica]|uniref:tail fiber protein n=1 Tax=Mesonia oceanica TaxID=2687242 RepID=UPI0012431035